MELDAPELQPAEPTVSNDIAASSMLRSPPHANLQSSTAASHGTRTYNIFLDSCKRAWERFKRALSPQHRDQRQDIFRQPILVTVVIGDTELRRTVIALIDPHCPVDVVSTHCLEKNFKDLDYKTLPGSTIGFSVTGREEYKSVGKVKLHWHGQKSKSRSSKTTPTFRVRFEESSFEVVESKEFEIILGRPTIDRLELYKSNRGIIATWIAPPSDFKDVSREQEAAVSRREEEKKSIEERKKQKKEQKKLDKKK